MWARVRAVAAESVHAPLLRIDELEAIDEEVAGGTVRAAVAAAYFALAVWSPEVAAARARRMPAGWLRAAGLLGTRCTGNYSSSFFLLCHHVIM